MTHDDEDYLAWLWAQGMPVSEMSRLCGYSRGYIRAYATRHRDKFPYRKQKIPIQKRELWISRIEAGRYTQAEVARKLGISRSTVSAWFINRDGDNET